MSQLTSLAGEERLLNGKLLRFQSPGVLHCFLTHLRQPWQFQTQLGQ